MQPLRILTFNTQLRSWGMEAGADKSLFPSENAEPRAHSIADRILASPQDYDIVLLNEVFDEDAREILADRLGGRFGSMITKADEDQLGLQLLGVGLLVAPSLISQLVGLGLIGWSLLEGIWEDSGLMLFSRLPFDTVPAPPEFAGVFPNGVPFVGYEPFSETAGNDVHAAKGMIYARLRSGADRVHVFASHTQADSDAVGEHAETRVDQMAQMQRFIETCVGTAAPFQEEVYLLGDLNIVGANTNPATPGGTPLGAEEWSNLFYNPGAFFTDSLVEAWGIEQCGDDNGRDPGHTAPARYEPKEQRLDYFLHPASFAGRLEMQHQCLALEILDPSSSYTSDHPPVRVDLAHQDEHNSVALAQVISAPPDASESGGIYSGSMWWFRVEEKGSYEIDLHQKYGTPELAAFAATNLSTPMPPFGISESERGRRFVFPDVPFFLRVSELVRDSKSGFELRLHRNEGLDRFDAIGLLPSVEAAVEAPSSPNFANDDSSTPFSDENALWFMFDTVKVDTGAEQTVEVQLGGADAAGFELSVVQLQDGNQWSVLGTDGPGSNTPSVRFGTADNGHFFAVARRLDPDARDLTAIWRTDLSVLYGRGSGIPNSEITLFCEDETDGFLGNEWGSDDIAVELVADESLTIKISNDQVGDFDDDDSRTLDPWITSITYVDKIDVTIIELDDTSANDRASATLLGADQLAGSPNFKILREEPGGVVHGELGFDFGDGNYRLTVTVGHWLPS